VIRISLSDGQRRALARFPAGELSIAPADGGSYHGPLLVEVGAQMLVLDQDGKLRRHEEPADPVDLRLDGLVVSESGRRCTLDGEPVSLTRREFDLLILLASDPLHAFSKADIYRRVWKRDLAFEETRTIDAHACRVRAKLQGRFIANVRGVGYRLTD
jgi:DNA-binding response OmpR family regulator